VERTRALVHVIDASRPAPLEDVRVLNAELAAYGGGLAEKPQVYALNKMDLAEARAREAELRAGLDRGDATPIFAVSALTGEGGGALLEAAAGLVARTPGPARPSRELIARRITHRGTARDWEIVRADDHFLVRSPRLERLARGIDWQSAEALVYFQSLLVRSGIDRELRRQGVREGDTVRVGSVELEWREASA
jgi:GTP-binding protein